MEMANHTKDSGHTTANGTANGSIQTNSDIKNLWDRYEHLALEGTMKNILIEEILEKYGNLTRTHAEYVKQHVQEREYAQAFRQREQQLLANLQFVQKLLNRDPHVLVLIDGDGMIFNNAFLRDGEKGGRQAAIVLHSMVAEWAQASVVECPADVKVVARVYANFKGLADVCTRAGFVDCPAVVEEFARGFTRGKTLFDFVDCGAGKDRADVKINEIFRLYVNDYHCRQILFGCTQDKGYARILEEYTTSEEALTRVTLLEGVPFEKELAALPFRTKKFSGVFRESKINLNASDVLTDCRPRVGSLNAASDIFTPTTNTPRTPVYTPNGSIPQLDGNMLAHCPAPARTDSITSSAMSFDGPSFSWAQKATAAAALHQSDMKRFAIPPAEPKTSTIKRNKKGQRLDEPLDYDRDEVQRVKKLKLCNQHYMGVNGCCHIPEKCHHRHDLTPTKQEMKWLRVVARETPCKRGSECDDKHCIYGHRCPFPLATEGSMRGIGCLVGDACRFPREMHAMDMVPVKCIRVTGAF